MNPLKIIALLTTLFFCMLANPSVFAGTPLNDLADYQNYGNESEK